MRHMRKRLQDLHFSQPGAGSIYALDNLWDGLACIMTSAPYLKFFFGKMTMYSQYNRQARNMILSFMKQIFPCDSSLLQPIDSVDPDEGTDAKFTKDSFIASFNMLRREVQKLGVNIPPLISSYMKLTTQMQVFGTSRNIKFGNVEETAILINCQDIVSLLRSHLTNEEFSNWKTTCK